MCRFEGGSEVQGHKKRRLGRGSGQPAAFEGVAECSPTLPECDPGIGERARGGTLSIRVCWNSLEFRAADCGKIDSETRRLAANRVRISFQVVDCRWSSERGSAPRDYEARGVECVQLVREREGGGRERGSASKRGRDKRRERKGEGGRERERAREREGKGRGRERYRGGGERERRRGRGRKREKDVGTVGEKKKRRGKGRGRGRGDSKSLKRDRIRREKVDVCARG